MGDVAIRVEGLGKQYRIGATRLPYHTLREQITRALTAPWRLLQRNGFADDRQTIWALRDVSFEIKRGEVVGIIGRNGAGKSTLLKILSRITEPTTGEVELHGRVGSLLEVGTGFNPELTGRENVYLNGAILGMKRAEIARKFDEIVAFAEVEKFIDTPVKHYSSGMYMRLAFAVAAHLEPEILVVDEVLAVGDAEFQKRCLGKMGEMAKGGRTVLFVSHNIDAIRRLCQRAICLEKGEIWSSGSVEAVVTAYLTHRLQKEAEVRFDPPHRFANGMAATLHSVRVTDSNGVPRSIFSAASPIQVEIEWENDQKLYKPRMGFILLTNDGIEVMCALDALSWETGWLGPGRRISCCTIPGGLLNEGEYMLDIGCDSPNRHDFTASRTGAILCFSIEDDMTLPNKYYGQEGFRDSRWAGILLMNIPWQWKSAQSMPNT